MPLAEKKNHRKSARKFVSSTIGHLGNGEPKTLKTFLRERAISLGFQIFGVCSAKPLRRDLERLRGWLAKGHAAKMESYMAREPEERANPVSLLPGAQSVIMVGISHSQSPPDYSALSGRPEGRVARFALGEDYHSVVRPRLEELARGLEEVSLTGASRSRVFVDTGPLLERALARRAGLGFIGKNNCLIHPRYGSWFTLGAIVTEHVLAPDAPVEAQCGECRLCLEACPSAALRGPYELDARRCLSYLTIETRDPLEPRQAAQIGTRLFGCDTCQEVCPFNNAPLECAEDRLRPGSGPAPTIERILAIESNRQYNNFFAGSALARARRKGLRRNAQIVASNLRRSDPYGEKRQEGKM